MFGSFAQFGTVRAASDYRATSDAPPRRNFARRRQRHNAITISAITSAKAVALLQNLPPGRSMVRDHSDGASPGRGKRNATTLSPIVVPASE